MPTPYDIFEVTSQLRADGLSDAAIGGILCHHTTKEELDARLKDLKTIRSLWKFALGPRDEWADPDQYDTEGVTNLWMEHNFTVDEFRKETINFKASKDVHTDNTRRVSMAADVYAARSAQIDELATKAGHGRR